MTVAGLLSHQAASGLNGTRQVAVVRIGCAAQARHTPTEIHRHQAATSVCLAAFGGLLAPKTEMSGTRRRATTAHAVVNPGTVTPGPDADDDAAEMASDAIVTDPHAGHAILHDFCMIIPYGLIMALAGIFALCFKGFSTGATLLGAGVLAELLAVLSLRSWQQHKGSQLFTAATAGITLVLTRSMWRIPAFGLAAAGAKLLSVLSGALLLFLVYNIMAGGNPPKKDGSADLAPAEQVEQIPLSPQT